MVSQKKDAPATGRNREPIYQVLKSYIRQPARLLEVASGTGQHAEYMSERFSGLIWQPSDVSAEALESIRAYQESGPENFLPPVQLNCLSGVWETGKWDYILCCNMIHISPWECTTGLLGRSAEHLDHGGLLMLYGPFYQKDVSTAPSNLAFDRSLQARDPSWGIRSLEKVSEEAGKNGFLLKKIHAMPANNLLVVWEFAR